MTTGIMEVNLVGARALKNTEFFGKIDPYVVIQYQKQEHKSSTGTRRKLSKARLQCGCFCVKGQGRSRPVWDEKFKFRVTYPTPAGEEQHYKLVINIMDRDSFTDDDYLGQATIYLKELFLRGVENGKAELPTQKYRVVSADQTYQGEIQVGLTFTTTGETGKKAKLGQGETHP